MDDASVIAAVQKALNSLSERFQTDELNGLPSDIREGFLLHDASKPIEAVLAAQPEFANPPMVNLLAGQTGFGPSIAAQKVVQHVRTHRSAEAAVAWLHKVLATKKARAFAIYTMWGVGVDAPFVLVSNIRLLPFASLPESRQKQALSEMPHLGAHLAFRNYTFESPSAALIAAVDIEPYLVRADTDNTGAVDRVNYRTRFEDIRHCLAMSGAATVMAGPSWFQYEDSDLEAAVIGAITSFSHQEVVPLSLPKRGAIDPETTADLVRAFFNLDEPLRGRVRTAIQRIHLAFIRTSPADAALELAIALETLLVDSPGENTFKIALRAALLSGDDIQSRSANRAIIEAAYRIRSALMHSGQSPPECKVRGDGRMPSADVAKKATDITVSVVRRILRDGHLPDWSSMELASGIGS